MLSFRDRFFTPKVATAMMSPLAIVAAGGGAAAGIVAGGALGPVGAVVGGVVGAVAAWATRVGIAIPKAPAEDRIDPFSVGEPWRRLTQDAIAAQRQFGEAVRSTGAGPIRDRLQTIGRRIDASVVEAWSAARAGHQLSDAYSRLDTARVETELRQVEARAAAGGTTDFATRATADALRSQLDTATRMSKMIHDTEAGLRLLNARLDESVARCIELSVGRYRPEEFSAVEGAVGVISDELEALRAAAEETTALQRPAAGTIP